MGSHVVVIVPTRRGHVATRRTPSGSGRDALHPVEPSREYSDCDAIQNRTGHGITVACSRSRTTFEDVMGYLRLDRRTFADALVSRRACPPGSPTLRRTSWWHVDASPLPRSHAPSSRAPRTPTAACSASGACRRGATCRGCLNRNPRAFSARFSTGPKTPFMTAACSGSARANPMASASMLLS